jgi:arylsulfatase A-like enzyme
MLDETLILVLSEHGRTPKIDSKPVGAGRDHWSRAYSQVYAGGGMGQGIVVGRTDKHAGDVEENPVSPKDVLATAFYLLGIDPQSTFPDPEGRPLPITGTGRFRPELLG